MKKNFEDVMNHIRDLGEPELPIHFQLIAKNATYMSHFTVDEMIKLISDKIVAKFLWNLLTSNDFLILTDESSDVDSSACKTTEEYVCIRKLSASKTAKTLMHTNAMSGEQKRLHQRIRHVSPFTIYMNCRNHRLA